ncbi:MAG: hypothetical protein FD146_852 [Anaerolineaceae bacterium]|nr:MAG: hypothetical protein FD146_852 [Anaerolineaceae bacterium]
MPPRRSPATPLTWGLLAAFGVILLLAGAAAFWNALAGWLTPEPAATRTPVPRVVPTGTRSPFEYPTLAPTNTLSPDLIPVTPSPVPTLAYLFQQGFPPYINPITGMMAADLSPLERRPIAVKISNFPRYVRGWQSGLSLADNVYEYYTEDLETRFIAVFYGTDASRVGPVRSARFFDEHITRMYHAYLVYSGADDRIDDYLAATDLKDFRLIPNEYDCPPLCWDNDIADYNNYFLDTSKVSAYLEWAHKDNTRQPLSGMVFTTTAPFTTNSAGRIFVRNSYRAYNYWQYDAATQKYLRFQETVDNHEGVEPAYTAHIDNLTGKQITADNLVVLLVRYIHNPQSTGQMYVVDLYNSGQAFIFRDGRVYEARWVRTAFDALLSFTDPGGNPLPLKTGVTWFQVIGLGSAYSNDGGDWFFDFQMP